MVSRSGSVERTAVRPGQKQSAALHASHAANEENRHPGTATRRRTALASLALAFRPEGRAAEEPRKKTGNAARHEETRAGTNSWKLDARVFPLQRRRED